MAIDVSSLKGALDSVDELMTPSGAIAATGLIDTGARFGASITPIQNSIDLMQQTGAISMEDYASVNGVLTQINTVQTGMAHCGEFATSMIADATASFANDMGTMQFASSIYSKIGEFSKAADCVAGFATLAGSKGIIDDVLGLADLDQVFDQLSSMTDLLNPNSIGALVANSSVVQDLLSPLDDFCDAFEASFNDLFALDMSRLADAVALVGKYASLASLIKNDPCRLVSDHGIFNAITEPIVDQIKGLWDAAHSPIADLPVVDQISAAIDAVIPDNIAGILGIPKEGFLDNLIDDGFALVGDMVPKGLKDIGAFASVLGGAATDMFGKYAKKVDGIIPGAPDNPLFSTFTQGVSELNNLMPMGIPPAGQKYIEELVGGQLVPKFVPLDKLPSFSEVTDLVDKMSLDLPFPLPKGDMFGKIDGNLGDIIGTQNVTKAMEGLIAGGPSMPDISIDALAKDTDFLDLGGLADDFGGLIGDGVEFLQSQMIAFKGEFDQLGSFTQELSTAVDDAKAFMTGGEMTEVMSAVAGGVGDFASARAEDISQAFSGEFNEQLPGTISSSKMNKLVSAISSEVQENAIAKSTPALQDKVGEFQSMMSGRTTNQPSAFIPSTSNLNLAFDRSSVDDALGIIQDSVKDRAKTWIGGFA